MAKHRKMEIAPVSVDEGSRRARRQRSEAVWRLLQRIFSNRAEGASPLLRDVAKMQGCS